MIALPRTESRPTGPVPPDDTHEFLSVWLPHDDPILEKWVHWFRRSRVRHTVRIQAMTCDGVTGIYAMIYTHRVILPHRGGTARWCCEEAPCRIKYGA